MHDPWSNGGRRRFVERAGASASPMRARSVLVSLLSSTAMAFAWACGGHDVHSNEVASPTADASAPPSGDTSGVADEPSTPGESANDAGDFVLGCSGPDAATGEGAPVARYDASACADVATIDAGACPTDKIAFRMCNACLNDGAVELCVNDGDDATLCAVRAIAPDITVLSTSKGRIGCSSRQRLVLIPVDKKDCTGPNRWTATDGLWSRICALAALAGVEKIAPTFYE